jgi:DNA-binding CsgD family transcriptional regulator
MVSQQDVSRLIGLVYDSAADPGMWQSTLSTMSEILDARAGHILMIEPGGRRQNVVTANFNLAEAEKYNAYYNRIDPVAPLLEETPVGRIVSCRDVVSRRDLENEFYRDWASPNDVGDAIFVNIERAPEGICSVVLARPWLSRPFATESTVCLLDLLIPHFQRAMQVKRSLAGTTLEEPAAAELVRTQHGCVLLGIDGRPIYANAIAREMTLEKDGLVLTQCGLQASAQDDAPLRQLIRNARPGRANKTRSGGRLTIERGAGRSAVTVQTLPLASHWLSKTYPGSTLVLIIDSERTAGLYERALQELYGLTRSEAALAARIPSSRSLQALADERGLRVSTVRTHLQRVFDKTGTHRQAELVQLIAELDGIAIEAPRGGGSLGV